jgi:glycosyltransferase involved in cell wall biosynthesis
VRGIIVTGGEFPQGSSARRARIFKKALSLYGLQTEILIGFPRLSFRDYQFLETGEYAVIKPIDQFQLPEQKSNRFIFRSSWEKLIAGYNIRKFILRTPLDFVITGPDIFVNIFITGFCKRKGILLIIERGDENRRKFIENKTLIDYLVAIYDNLSDTILKQRNVMLFVVSNYLEKKYSKKFPSIKIVRAPPSMIDIVEFDIHSNNSLEGQIPSEVNKSLHSKKTKFCFAGSCVFTNGLIFTLESLYEIKNQGFDFVYYLVFHKGFTSQIRDKIIELSLESNTFIINGLYPEYIPAFYKLMDILILPEMGTEVAEAGFPGKISEYLASGKAIISTKFSNLEDYLIHRQNCLMSEIGDKAQYVENLKELITDKKLRICLGKNSRITAEKHFRYENAILPIINVISNNAPINIQCV